LAKPVSPLIGYPVAVAAATLALIIRTTVLAGAPYCAFIAVYPTIIAVAVLFGFGPGLVATALSALAFYFQPVAGFGLVEGPVLVTLLGFVVTTILVCILIQWLRHTIRALIAHQSALQVANDHTATLYRELDHRVRNSLQIAASMLTFQAAGKRSLEVREALEDAAARIRGIALMHDFLAVSSDLREVDLDRYLAKLCAELTEHTGLQCTVEAESIRMGTTRASMLAMIAHELITNVSKYAYPGGAGPVSVLCRREPDGTVRLTVADMGVGLPESIEPGDGGGLGMRIIRSLVEQLNGRFEIARRAGTQTSIIVPV
jgi:two-component sensor histidine kinase